MESMVALHCHDRSRQTDPTLLFAKLVDVEPAEDFSPLGEEREAQELLVIEIDADGKDVYDNNGSSDHKFEDYNDLDQDEVLDDINDEGANDNEHVNTTSVGNPNRGIVICNDLGAYMSIIDPDTADASEFLE
ncbi:hypothetical protein GOBAR_AA02353 [Gossypium barbadense]|uniref:Uncharacterized protein n=1 Tax=Gossypium barbadense TaxID=3634 RepID=A0A2P5YRI6_GOSBA|nr:hypothetical protein GOBAR_AA02353 [Gossypium barbadense]